jgi:hypothetical protein
MSEVEFGDIPETQEMDTVIVEEEEEEIAGENSQYALDFEEYLIALRTVSGFEAFLQPLTPEQAKDRGYIHLTDWTDEQLGDLGSDVNVVKEYVHQPDAATHALWFDPDTRLPVGVDWDRAGALKFVESGNCYSVSVTDKDAKFAKGWESLFPPAPLRPDKDEKNQACLNIFTKGEGCWTGDYGSPDYDRMDLGDQKFKPEVSKRKVSLNTNARGYEPTGFKSTSGERPLPHELIDPTKNYDSTNYPSVVILATLAALGIAASQYRQFRDYAAYGTNLGATTKNKKKGDKSAKKHPATAFARGVRKADELATREGPGGDSLLLEFIHKLFRTKNMEDDEFTLVKGVSTTFSEVGIFYLRFATPVFVNMDSAKSVEERIKKLAQDKKFVGRYFANYEHTFNSQLREDNLKEIYKMTGKAFQPLPLFWKTGKACEEPYKLAPGDLVMVVFRANITPVPNSIKLTARKRMSRLIIFALGNKGSEAQDALSDLGSFKPMSLGETGEESMDTFSQRGTSIVVQEPSAKRARTGGADPE